MKIPSYVKKYFWEVDTKELDLNKNSEYVASRILEYGDPKAANWLFKNISQRAIKKVVLKRRDLSLRSRIFWGIFLNLSRKCLKKFYLKKQNSLWPY